MALLVSRECQTELSILPLSPESRVQHLLAEGPGGVGGGGKGTNLPLPNGKGVTGPGAAQPLTSVSSKHPYFHINFLACVSGRVSEWLHLFTEWLDRKRVSVSRVSHRDCHPGVHDAH